MKQKIYEVDYTWLFDQFSQNIASKVRNPEYIDLIAARFSTSTLATTIATQIMIISLLQEYFTYTIYLGCGTKGVEMLSNIDIEDWKVLITKIDQLTEILEPTDDVLELSGWF